MLALCWAALNPGDWASWVVGAPTVLLGATLGSLLPAPAAYRLCAVGALRFVVMFARLTVSSSFDVAARVLRPRIAIAPGIKTYDSVLPEGAPRVLFACAITLLPGTLTADLRGRRLTIHCLNESGDVEPELAIIEDLVAGVFGLQSASEEAA